MTLSLHTTRKYKSSCSDRSLSIGDMGEWTTELESPIRTGRGWERQVLSGGDHRSRAPVRGCDLGHVAESRRPGNQDSRGRVEGPDPIGHLPGVGCTHMYRPITDTLNAKTYHRYMSHLVRYMNDRTLCSCFVKPYNEYKRRKYLHLDGWIGIPSICVPNGILSQSCLAHHGVK